MRVKKTDEKKELAEIDRERERGIGLWVVFNLLSVKQNNTYCHVDRVKSRLKTARGQRSESPGRFSPYRPIWRQVEIS